MITTNQWESTVTITDLHSQIPSQFIDTNTLILGLALTGSILLVVDLETVVAWQLTEEGLVDCISGKSRASHGNSIWTIPAMAGITSLKFSVEDQTVVIALNGIPIHTHHMEAREGVEHAKDCLQPPIHWHDLWDTSQGQYHLHSSILVLEGLLSCELSEGWMGDLEAGRQLWVPAE